MSQLKYLPQYPESHNLIDQHNIGQYRNLTKQETTYWSI